MKFWQGNHVGGAPITPFNDDEDSYFDDPAVLTTTIVIAAAVAGSALLLSLILAIDLLKRPCGNAKMEEIAKAIQDGAAAFLKSEYTVLSVFVVIAAIVVGLLLEDAVVGIFLVVGAVLSALTGYIGMWIAVRANVRTAAAAQYSLNGALRVAINSGAVMGFSVVGFGLGGLSVLYLILDGTTDDHPEKHFERLAGFAMGASTIALFARVGGGIYTKAADVGADLVGKVEAGIPEDDPRNPGVIADNVGDNVGDVAGMGADLFESYVGSIIAASTLGMEPEPGADRSIIYPHQIEAAMLPFFIATVGIVASAVGLLAVRTKEGANQSQLLRSMSAGVWVSSIVLIAVVSGFNWGLFGIATEYTICIFVGLIAGILIGYFTEYFTSFEYSPVQGIAKAGITGPATVVIQGIGVGQISTLPLVIVVCLTIFICVDITDNVEGDYTGGVYGVALAAVGMLSTLGMTLATDAYGPVADNAGGIAEMAELPETVRERTDNLDALGNTTAATGKGFAIGSAVLTALGLVTAYANLYQRNDDGVTEAIDLLDGRTVVGLLFGLMLPFLFSALTMLAVGKSAGAIIAEVRRQFRDIDGLLEGRDGVKADYERCVVISTNAAIKEMVVPGLLAVVVPFIVGYGLGPTVLAGTLFGSIGSGFMLAIMMANSGGAWDNSKKWVETGELGGKGTEIHAATVVGDTIGDPFKDTSGPALNILLKLMSVVALVIAPQLEEPAEDENFPELWWAALIVLIVSTVFSLGWLHYLDKSSPRPEYRSPGLSDVHDYQRLAKDMESGTPTVSDPSHSVA